jgi:pimeloyl-ACP methyl ester carboxylesterase
MTHLTAFKSSEGEAAYFAEYDAAMKMWPVPYDEMDITSRFGVTHLVVSGPRNAPPLVLLHGYWATLTMWAPNMAEFSKGRRVYAIDVMGQPGKSLPDEPIRNAAEHLAWLTTVLDALHLDKISLAGMSFGGWLALNYAAAAPQRVQALVLLSPAASLLPLVKQFALRGILMMLLTNRFTVGAFMRWLGFKDGSDDPTGFETRAIDLTYLGLKHFRFPRETARIAPTVYTDSDLRAMQVPTLLLMGEREVIYDSASAMSRARRLMPHLEGELVSGCSHDMTIRQHRLVDARVVDYLARHDGFVSRHAEPQLEAAPRFRLTP